MRHRTKSNVGVLVVLCGLMVAAPVLAIVADQVDDFEDGTVMSWTEGPASPNPPTNVVTGGPAGDGDNFLRDASSGGFGSGSRMILFNQGQWAGDYLAAGVTQIEMDLINLGATALSIRIALEAQPGGFPTHFGSAVAVNLAPGSGWQHVSFSLDAGDLASIDGPADLATVLSQVTEMRILHAPAGPTWRGGPEVAAVLGIDNITAVAAPQGGAGRVPNGADAPGEQLTVSLDGGMLTLAWGASCSAGDTDYSVYAGTLGLPSSHTPSTCSTDGATQIDVLVPEGDVYFLIVPHDGSVEGSYGFDSAGVPRPPSGAACRNQSIVCE